MLTLFEQVLSYIQAPDPACFESLALAVFHYQAEHVPVYRAYLASLDIDARRVNSLKSVPPVSTLAFKYARVENELHPARSKSCVFLTSGTTIGRDERGRHVVPHLEIYRASAVNHLRRMMFPDGMRMAALALHPTADRMPESSLAQMISWCVDEFGDSNLLCASTGESVNVAEALEFLHAVHRLNVPVCILGTTASCASLFFALRDNGVAIRLPEGSRLMDTGGAKGQRVPLSPQQVAADALELLGIPPALVINEYGMTEMCSQLYDATSFNSQSGAPPGERIKLAPPWLKPTAIDPITLKPTSAGQPGVLAFFDLANVGSISALMTEDIGIVRGDAVIVLGRAMAADPRGCALAIEQFAAAEKPSSSTQAPVSTRSAFVIDGQPCRFGAEAAGPERSLGPAAPELDAAERRLRSRLATRSPSVTPQITGAAFNAVMEAVWGSQRWKRAISSIAAKAGCSEALLEVSLRALVTPLREAGELARKIRQRRELFGFIMPGNVPGAGLHELVIALAAGGAAIVKTSSSEPVFFTELAATLRDVDSRFGSDFGSRLEVFCWGRERADLTDVLVAKCDQVIALGNDATIEYLKGLNHPSHLLTFGSRISGALIMREALQQKAIARTAEALALDCAMFDQRGCLSPHHIFVEGDARRFAVQLAAAFSGLAPLLSGSDAFRRLEFQGAAALRRVRERARWRKLAGGDIELWEEPSFQWTVILDQAASFTSSPGFRTTYVSPFIDASDLENRLEPVRGRMEAFAIANGESPSESAGAKLLTGITRPAALELVCDVIRRCAATYVCAPGEMQSPPLEWPHGGGEFLRMFIGD
jgi:Acyl-CoA reductase (LuxC)/Acyl-protein synthetase, LuxE